jgi:hypothetical protein
MLFDVYGLEWPAHLALPPFFGDRFSLEAARGLELIVKTGWGARAERERGVA